MRQLIVVGIDPGTTAGYAVAILEGENFSVGKIYSEKNIGVDKLISEISEQGRVVAVATDKKRVPQTVQRIASKLGAIIISPADDMKVNEKRQYAKQYNTKNDHERDSLGAALYAHKKLKPIIKSVHTYLKEQGKLKEFNRILPEVLTSYDMDVKAILTRLETKPKQSDTGKQHKHDYKRTIERLSDKITRLQTQVASYEQRLTLQKQSKKENKTKHIKVEKSKESITRARNRTIGALRSELDKSHEKIRTLEKNYDKLARLILGKKHIAMQKLDNLGWKVYSTKKFEHDELVYVENPEVYSKQTIQAMQRKPLRVVTKKIPKWHDDEANWIQSKDAKDFGKIVLIEKKAFERARKKNSKEILNILHEYKEKRREE